MFKTSHEFKFSVQKDDTTQEFTGQLVFTGSSVNSIGTLHTEEELLTFGALLNESLPVPEYWSLETLAEAIFTYARPVFTNLNSVTLFLSDEPQRVTEYSKPYADVDGEVFELGDI